MHASKRILGEALKPVLKVREYRKRAMTWHRANEHTIQVFHVEKNRWGFDAYSLHFAIYLKALGSELTPPYFRCPVQGQLHQLTPDRIGTLNVCDFEKGSMAMDARIAEIVRLVNEYGLPWLDAHSSIANLKNLVNIEYYELLKKVTVFRAAYDYLRAS